MQDRETIAGVLSGFTRLPLHPDVEPGLRRVHETGVRIVTLTNGSAARQRGQGLRGARGIPSGEGEVA
jgi:hypothetical protein